MKASKYSALTEASFAWIKAHPDALNTDIPEDLLHGWLNLFESLEGEAEDTCIAIFAFGVSARIDYGFRRSGEKAVTISYGKLFEYFKRWHFRLLMAKLETARPEGGALQSIRLFDFEPPELDYGGGETPL